MAEQSRRREIKIEEESCKPNCVLPLVCLNAVHLCGAPILVPLPASSSSSSTYFLRANRKQTVKTFNYHTKKKRQATKLMPDQNLAWSTLAS